MRDQIVRALQTEYEAQRVENQREEARRLAQATALDPAIAMLWEKRSALFQGRMRMAFHKPDEAMQIGAELTSEIKKINETLRKKLVMAGLAEDYLQPVYRCDACRDTGYTGDVIREMCPCFHQRLIARVCEETGLGLSESERFERFRSDLFSDMPEGNGVSQREYMERVRDLAEAYADHFPRNEKRNLLFFGPSGLGKTFLMHCIGQRVLERGHTPVQVTAYRLMTDLKEAQFGRGESGQVRTWLETPLLMIDDLGTEPMLENITLVQWFNLFNERGVHGLHTVVSTNLTMKELQARYTERVCSRMLDARHTSVLRFWGNDLRLKTK